MHRKLAAAILFVAATIHGGSAIAQDSERKFPAKITIASQYADKAGRRHIRVRLVIDSDVAVYANPVGFAGMEHASARLTVFDANRKRLPSEVKYPRGEKLETGFPGNWYLYRNSVDLELVVPSNAPLPLTVRCQFAGYNERASYCLGAGRRGQRSSGKSRIELMGVSWRQNEARSIR